VENSGGISASLAGRYATALFDLAQNKKTLDKVEASLDSLSNALNESPDLRALISSPVVGRDAAKATVAALAKKMKLDTLTGNTLGVLADNRRLSELPAVIRSFGSLLSAHRGEVRAEVVSAFPLSDVQVDAVKANLKKRVGSDVTVSTKVDPSLLGGLVVRIGSQMIDSSIKTRLNSLANAMKG
jgi:F-type H+-transporting ATPase subunit delta